MSRKRAGDKFRDLGKARTLGSQGVAVPNARRTLRDSECDPRDGEDDLRVPHGPVLP